MEIEFINNTAISVAIRVPDLGLFYNFGTNKFELWDFSVPANSASFIKNAVAMPDPLVNYWTLKVDLSAFPYDDYSVIILDPNNNYKALCIIPYSNKSRSVESTSWVDVEQGA